MHATPKPARHLLDVDAAAEHLGVTVRFMRRVIIERRLKHYKVGSLVRFDVADLDAYVDAGMREVRQGAGRSS